MTRILLCCLTLLLLSPFSAEAGIVVTTNGKVYVGTIESDGVSEDGIKIQLRKQAGIKGSSRLFTIERRKVRWFDREGQRLTLAYAKTFKDAVIDKAWRKSLEDLLATRPSQTPPLAHDVRKLLFESTLERAPSKTVGKADFRITVPAGWVEEEKDGIIVATSVAKAKGFHTRIQLFAVKRRSDWSKNEHAELYRGVLKKLGAKSMTEVKGDGDELSFTTTSVHDGEEILGTRHLLFRGDRVFVVCLYATRKEHKRLAKVFDECLASLELD